MIWDLGASWKARPGFRLGFHLGFRPGFHLGFIRCNTFL